MSRFFSSKYLKYRNAKSLGSIDRDLPCRSCGYNLRGLNYGRNCPECGTMIEFPDTTSSGDDILLSADHAERSAWRLGLSLAMVCVIIALASRLVAIANVGPWYLWLGLINSLLWIWAVFLITPARFDRLRSRSSIQRRVIRISQLLWIFGYACWLSRELIFSGTNTEGLMQTLQLLSRFGAGIGVLVLIDLLRCAAEDAELERAARLLTNAQWGLPAFTLILALFPETVAWFTFVWVMVFRLAWGIFMVMLFLAMLQMERHVAWAQRVSVDHISRDERIRQQRAELDAQVQSTIRPINGNHRGND